MRSSKALCPPWPQYHADVVDISLLHQQKYHCPPVHGSLPPRIASLHGDASPPRVASPPRAASLHGDASLHGSPASTGCLPPRGHLPSTGRLPPRVVPLHGSPPPTGRLPSTGRLPPRVADKKEPNALFPKRPTPRLIDLFCLLQLLQTLHRRTISYSPRPDPVKPLRRQRIRGSHEAARRAWPPWRRAFWRCPWSVRRRPCTD